MFKNFEEKFLGYYPEKKTTQHDFVNISEPRKKIVREWRGILE